jgi:hypothetical protein
MDRIEVTRRALQALGNGTYLEIGVDTGMSFIPTRATRKWGVDPGLKLTGRRRFKYAVFTALGLKEERLFPVTSDEFFSTQKSRLAKYGVDVSLVDGLHTYDQTLRDARNVLEYLHPKGVIVLHDCNPTTEIMAAPASSMEEMIARKLPDWDGAWNGDVWKVIVHARSLWNDVNAFVLDCDFGVGIITRGQPSVRLPYSETDIERMDYQFLDANRKELLGLEPPAYFDEFFRRHFQGNAA